LYIVGVKVVFPICRLLGWGWVSNVQIVTFLGFLICRLLGWGWVSNVQIVAFLGFPICRLLDWGWVSSLQIVGLGWVSNLEIELGWGWVSNFQVCNCWVFQRLDCCIFFVSNLQIVGCEVGFFN